MQEKTAPALRIKRKTIRLVLLSCFRKAPVSRFLAVLKYVSGVAAGLGLVACAALQPAAPDVVVGQQASARWQALLAKEYSRAYEMAVPSYRKLKTLDEYTQRMRQVPVRWISAKVLRVECSSDVRCVAKVELHSTPVVPFAPKIPLVGVLDEVWVYEDGRWWMFEAL